MSLLIVATPYHDVLQQGTAAMISVPWPIHMCNMTHSHVWHDSSICATWLIHMCNMTHHIYSTVILQEKKGRGEDEYICDMTHSYVWFIHTSHMTPPHVCHCDTAAKQVPRRRRWVLTYVRGSWLVYVYVRDACVCVVRVSYVCGILQQKKGRGDDDEYILKQQGKSGATWSDDDDLALREFFEQFSTKANAPQIIATLMDGHGCVCVCVWARARVFLCVWMYVCTHVGMFVCLHVCLYVCMYACMHVYMCACMYICVCVSI